MKKYRAKINTPWCKAGDIYSQAKNYSSTKLYNRLDENGLFDYTRQAFYIESWVEYFEEIKNEDNILASPAIEYGEPNNRSCKLTNQLYDRHAMDVTNFNDPLREWPLKIILKNVFLVAQNGHKDKFSDIEAEFYCILNNIDNK